MNKSLSHTQKYSRTSQRKYLGVKNIALHSQPRRNEDNSFLIQMILEDEVPNLVKDFRKGVKTLK